MKPHRFEHSNKDDLVSEDRKRSQPPEDIIDRSMIDGGIVADLGCGNGFLTIPLSHVVEKVIALDAQKEMLENLLKRSADRAFNIRPVLAELPAIPLRDESADHIFIVNMLHEIDEKVSMVKEVHRVLRNGGGATVVDFQKKFTKKGPPLNERIEESDVPSIFMGFQLVRHYSFDEFYQYVFRKGP
ncbi:MAG: class I SAM-dependent methyltransferase [Methanomassiliicoccales archaeon]|nr:MAG: class I SAM-dependent methyltransferase [Methanomassiliicoccales archaeon]